MIRTYIGLPPLFPSPAPRPFPLMARGCTARASLMFTNASQKYRRYITDHLSEQSAIVTECSANIRLYRRCFGEHSPNHSKSIFFIGTAGIYAQNRKASGSIACIIIHFTIADAKIPNGTEALGTCFVIFIWEVHVLLCMAYIYNRQKLLQLWVMHRSKSGVE